MTTTNNTPKRVVVTGASVGIGAATVRQFAAAGWSVLAVARREDKLKALAAETGCDYVAADITSDADVARIVEAAGPTATTLINNAGGARGLEPVADADLEKWRWMYEVNVIGTVRLTKAMIPVMRAAGDGTIVVVSSIAGHVAYENGAGYTGAKHAETVVAKTLRLELAGEPIRVIEIDPGLVATEEFSLSRFDGDQARADAVYEGVKDPLVGDDIADAIVWTVTRPAHVNIDQLVIKPIAQAAAHKLIRDA